MRDLLPSEAGRAATRTRAQAHVRRAQLLTASYQELGQRVSIHPRSMARIVDPDQGSRVPG